MEENPNMQGVIDPETQIQKIGDSEAVAPPPHSKLPRRLWLVPIFVVMSIALGTWMGINLKQNKNKAGVPESVPAPTSTLLSLKGEVSYLAGSAWREEGEVKSALEQGDLINPGDVIQTGDGSLLVINLDDGSVIRLSEATKISINSLTAEQISLRNYQGKIYSRVQKDAQHKFWVLADNLVVEASGTMFLVEKSDEIEVLVLESAVKVNEEGNLLAEINEQKKWQSKDNQIKDLGVDEMKNNDFLAWNIDQDNMAVLTVTPKLTIEPTAKPTVKPTSSQTGIILKGSAGNEGVKLTWVLNGIDAPNGVKIIRSLEANPSYPGDDFVYLGDTSQKSYQWVIKDGKLWHFRVCRYVDNACSHYSNDIGVQTIVATSKEKTTETTSQINSISLSVQKQDDKAILSWIVDGSSPKGFKIAWSPNENPTYPPREDDLWYYASDSSSREYTVSGLSGNWNFRVCEYLGGACGKYSNNVAVTF